MTEEKPDPERTRVELGDRLIYRAHQLLDRDDVRPDELKMCLDIFKNCSTPKNEKFGKGPSTEEDNERNEPGLPFPNAAAQAAAG